MKNRNKKYIFTLLAMGIFLFSTNGCTLKGPTSNNNRNAIDEALRESINTNRSLSHSPKRKQRSLRSLQNALMPELNIPHNRMTRGKLKKNEQRFDIAVNNVSAKDFFMGLVKDTPYNMTVNPDIKGNISLELKNVTIPQTMDAVRDTYGFEYRKTSYGYKIFPRQLETKTFRINYLDLNRSGQSQTTVGSGQITNTVQNTLTSSGVQRTQHTGSIPSGIVNTSSNSKFWELLKENLTAIVGEKKGRSVVVNPKSGSVVVKAYPNELRAVASFLDEIQNIIHRQVIIEAKILEVELNAGFQNGINWKVLGLQQNSTLDNVNSSTNNQTNNLFPENITGIFEMKATSGSAFSSFISMLNSQGNVNVLSSPRIATINNQKAVIKVGGDKFFITDISNDTTNNSGSSNPTTTSDVTLTPFFSGISLDVTPQIDENDYITIHIHPIVSQVTEDNRTFTVNDKKQVLPLAASTVKESDSIVRAKNGQVIVIGGLMASEGRNHQDSTPGADHLPGIGGLFKNNKKSSRKFELVILLRPIIAETIDTWQQELHKAYSNVRRMKGDFSYNIVPTKRKR